MHRGPALFHVALVLLWTGSCAGASEPDAGPLDAGEPAPDCEGFPEPSDPCLAGQCGNEIGVGQPCTRGGYECSDLPIGMANICTADFSDTELWYCTRPCDNDEVCGEGALCAIDPDDPGAGSGCIPAACE